MDKIAFTGSARTARKVMAACAENLTPMIAECGGKDGLLVSADANLDAAADAAVWGALSNAGQTCIGIERVYVAQGVYHTSYESKGYWFRTPEAWDITGNYRASMYMRPAAIWAMEMTQPPAAK